MKADEDKIQSAIRGAYRDGFNDGLKAVINLIDGPTGFETLATAARVCKIAIGKLVKT